MSDSLNIEAIRKINPTVIKEDGSIKSFKEQLLEYEYGYYDVKKPFVVLPSSMPLEACGAKNYPITMRPGLIRKLKDKHDLYYEDIAELPTYISQNNVLLLDSYTHENSVCMYLDVKGSHDEPLFCAFHLDRKADLVDINELASVYERKNVEFTIRKTIEKGLKVYPNHKTKNWLHALGLQLPGDIASKLSIPDSEAIRDYSLDADKYIPPEVFESMHIYDGVGYANYFPYEVLNNKQKELVDNYDFKKRIEAAKKCWGLDKLIDDSIWQVRVEVLEQGFGYEKLAFDPDTFVRAAVASKGFGLDKLINDEQLAFAEDLMVVEAAQTYLNKYYEGSLENWIAHNPDKCLLPENRADFIPYAELSDSQKSLVDSKEYIDRLDAIHQHIGLDRLIYDLDYTVRGNVVLEGYGLDRLIEDNSWWVRSFVAGQGYGLDKLIDDPSDFVNSNAQIYLDNHYVGSLDSWKMANPEKCVLPENRTSELFLKTPKPETQRLHASLSVDLNKAKDGIPGITPNDRTRTNSKER